MPNLTNLITFDGELCQQNIPILFDNKIGLELLVNSKLDNTLSASCVTGTINPQYLSPKECDYLTQAAID